MEQATRGPDSPAREEHMEEGMKQEEKPVSPPEPATKLEEKKAPAVPEPEAKRPVPEIVVTAPAETKDVATPSTADTNGSKKPEAENKLQVPAQGALIIAEPAFAKVAVFHKIEIVNSI